MGALHQALLMSHVASVGGGFNPADYLPGYDLDPDPAAVTGNDGYPVIDAPDISGSGFHYGQNTTLRQPTIKRGIYNGRDAIRFGANKCLVPDPTRLTYGPANTLVCICTPSTSAEYVIKGGGGEGGPALISGFASPLEYFIATGAHERASYGASISGPHIFTICKTDDSGNYIGYLDDVQVFSNAVIGSDDWNSFGVEVIGAFTPGTSNYTGDILRAFHFNQNHAGTSGLADLIAAAKIFWGI